MRQAQFQPQLKGLTLAMATALAALAPSVARADCTPASPTSWTSGNCTISSHITGSNALSASGSLGTLTNSGTISGSSNGIENSGTIALLNNTTIGKISSSGSIALFNNGTIGTLNNSGTISGKTYGILESVSIGTLLNSGVISGMTIGLDTEGGTIGTLTNSGTISGDYAIQNGGTLIALQNNGGLIHGQHSGINNNHGNIGTLSNSGTISGGTYGINNPANSSLGRIINTGLIAGTIRNAAEQSLTINGGNGVIFGTLTGSSGGISAGAVGNIANVGNNLVFASGNQLLNDNVTAVSVNLGGGCDGFCNVSPMAVASATLRVTNPIHITGNYTQTNIGTLQLGVANGATSGGVIGDSGYGRLLVSGSAVLNAGATIALHQSGSFGFAAGQRFLVIQAATGSTNYNVGSLRYQADGFSGTITGEAVADGENSDLVLVLSGSVAPVTPITPVTPVTPATITNAINLGSTSNAMAVLGGLSNYSGVDPALMNLSNAVLALGSTAAANHAGAQLSPASIAGAGVQAAMAPTLAVLNVVHTHADSQLLAETYGVSGIAAGESSYAPAVWGEGFGGRTSQSQRDQVSGYSAAYNGILLGADRKFGDRWRAGGVLSYGNTSVAESDDNTGSGTHVNAYGLIGYASYYGAPWHLDLTLGAISQNYDTQRMIDFNGFTGNAFGQHSGMQYVTSVEGGYAIDLSRVLPDATLTPLAGLTASTLHQEGYRESGGNGAALVVDGSNTRSVKSDLGAKLERAYTSSGRILVPSLQLTWRHEYQRSRLQTGAIFAADSTGSSAFTTESATPQADSAVLTLGLTMLHSQNLTLTAQYQVEHAHGFTSQTGDVRVRWLF